MKNFGRRKGAVTAANVLGAIILAALVVMFFYFIYPIFFGDLFKSIALTSSEIVARDMAGFISVSGVAPNEIHIDYSPASTVTYNVTIADRVVRIFLGFTKNVGVNIAGAPRTESFVAKEVASSKTAIDNLKQQISNENSFEISKSVQAAYDQNGNKILQAVYSVVGTSLPSISGVK